MVLVAVASAGLGVWIGTLVDSDDASHADAQQSTTTTAQARQDVEDLPGVGEQVTVGDWHVVVQSTETQGTGAGMQLRVSVLLTNTATESRTWVTPRQVALTFFMPPFNDTSNHSIRSPDSPRNGEVEVGPGATDQEEYLWSLPRGADNFLLGFSDRTGGEIEEAVVNLACCSRP